MKSLNKVDSNANKIVALSWCRTKSQCFVGICLYITIAGRGTPKENIQPCTWIQLRIAAILHEGGGLILIHSANCMVQLYRGSVCIHKSILCHVCSVGRKPGADLGSPPPPHPPIFEKILFIPIQIAPGKWLDLPLFEENSAAPPPPPPFFLKKS